MTLLAPERPVVAGTAARYAVVRDLGVDADGCALTLEDPTRSCHRLRIACTPDHDAVSALQDAGLRPLAQRVDVTATGDARCGALFTTGHGPERRAIPLATALALCEDGLRTVVTRVA